MERGNLGKRNLMGVKGSVKYIGIERGGKNSVDCG